MLPLDCIEQYAPDSGMPEFDFIPTAKYTLVELRNEICIQFHFLAKSAPIDYSAR